MVSAAHGPHHGRQHVNAPAAMEAHGAGGRDSGSGSGSGGGRPEVRSAAVGRPLAPRHPEESLLAALAAAGPVQAAVRYRGFVLLPQKDLGWLVRPERSPMTVLPFRTPPISLSDVKALVDWRLDASEPVQPAVRARTGA
jgi:hypothetical protein